MANVIIAGSATGATALPVADSIDATQDYIPIYTNSVEATQAINRNTYLGLGSAPLGLTDSQSPTNKTFNNTNAFTIKDGSLTLQNSSSTTKQAVFSLSGITAGQTRTMTLPDYNATLASLAGTETLTNKTLTSPTINSPTITNASITADAVTGYSASTTGTIYGVSIASGVLTSPTLSGTVAGNLTFSGSMTLSSSLSVSGQASLQTGTSPPASGANTAGIKMSSTSNFGLFFGSGAPTFSAAQGSLYMRTDGSSSSTRLYVNSTGSTTWVNITSAS